MYFINYVRILTQNNNDDLTKNLEINRKYMISIGIRLYYSVCEVSPEGLKHIHTIVFIETREDFVYILNKLNTSRLKKYIDKAYEIPNEKEAGIYYRYINKQFIGKDPLPRTKGVNCNWYGNDTLNFDKINKINYLKNTIDFDIFVPDD